MPEDLGKVCERYLCSRFTSFTNQLIGVEHKRHSILNHKLVFKKYTKNPLDKFRRLYTNTIGSKVKEEIAMPSNNNVVLTAFNNTNSQQLSNGSSDISVSSQASSSDYSPSKSLSSVQSSMSSLTSLSMEPLTEWKLLHERGSGLVNLGNTCFINASLQILANCPPLVQWLINNSHFSGCRVKAEKQFCLFCEAEHVIKLIHRNGISTTNNNTFSSQAVAPTLIVRRIKDISTTFKQGRQEDASEFLICLLDKIVDSCLRSSQPPERLLPSSGINYDKLCHSQTILHDLFGLVLRSRVQCGRCHQTSDTYEVHYMWIVSVRNRYELQQSLQQFICKETLSGENLYRCIKCKILVQATKRYTLHKTPKILLINLKRFEFGKNSHKLSHLVRYAEHLNVYPYLSEETQQTIKQQTSDYRLYAVLVHVGSSMHSGHYYAYVRSPNNLWYKADDTSMIKCQTNEVLNQYGAYILCYMNETQQQHSGNGNGITNGIKIATSKLVMQNGKTNGNTMPFYTSLQVPSKKIPKQVNAQNSLTEQASDNVIKAPFKKPSVIAQNSNSNQLVKTNGSIANGNRPPIVIKIQKKISYLNKQQSPQTSSSPNLNCVSSITSQQSADVSTSNTTPSHVIKSLKSSSTTNISNEEISSKKLNGHTSCSATFVTSTVQSTSSPLKIIIKTSPTKIPSLLNGNGHAKLNGLKSISQHYYNDGDSSSSSPDFLSVEKRIDDIKEKQELVLEETSIVSRVDAQFELIKPGNDQQGVENDISHSMDEQQQIVGEKRKRHHEKKRKKHKHHKRFKHRSRSPTEQNGEDNKTNNSDLKDDDRSHHHHHHHHRSRCLSSSSNRSLSPISREKRQRKKKKKERRRLKKLENNRLKRVPSSSRSRSPTHTSFSPIRSMWMKNKTISTSA